MNTIKWRENPADPFFPIQASWGAQNFGKMNALGSLNNHCAPLFQWANVFGECPREMKTLPLTFVYEVMLRHRHRRCGYR